MFEDFRKDNSFETNPELGRTYVKHVKLMIHVFEKPTKLLESKQHDAKKIDAFLVKNIHLSEREQLTTTGEKCRKMSQPKLGLSKKQIMEIDVNLVKDIEF